MNPKQRALQDRMERVMKRARWAGSKGESRAIHEAIKKHKKLPTFDRKFREKDPAFARLTIEEYEKKYPTWDDK